MYYFAYGSNLDPDQMRVRCPDHKVVGLAALRDHKLSFPLMNPEWGGGVAGLAVSHGAVLWGVVYELSDADIAALDQHEGFVGEGSPNNVYDREAMWVELKRPDDGSIPRRIRAATYVPRQVNPARPSPRYIEAILRGARHHRLPDEYVARLAQIETAEPPASPTDA